MELTATTMLPPFLIELFNNTLLTFYHSFQWMK
jgi:hypothetical protein